MPAVQSATPIIAYAQINNQAPPFVPLDTFDVQLAAYGSVGHFSCTTAISALANYGWGSNNLLGTTIENAQPSLADGSPSYPISIFATGAYTGTVSQIFAGDIDELAWDFDRDELRITGRDYGGRIRDWEAVLTSKWTNMNYSQFATAIITGVGLTPQIATSSNINTALKTLLFGIGDLNVPGLTRFGYTNSGIADESSMYTSPQNMWELLNKVARSIGFIVTVHPDKTVYVGPPGGDTSLNLTPRMFTWLAPHNTQNITPVRQLTIDHGPRQYGTFSVHAFSYHPPSVQIANATVVGLAGSPTIPTLGRQPISAGIYKSQTVASSIEDGKPNYFYFLHGLTDDQVTRAAVGLTFDIAQRLYVIEGEIDGDPTLVPTTPLTLQEAVPGALQGYVGKSLAVASVNHVFDMQDGYNTRFKAWYAPNAPTAPGEVSEETTS